MSLAQCQQLLLGRWLGLIGMSNGCTAAIFKPRFPLHLAPPQPLVAALPRDLVDPAQLRHRPLPALILLHKPLPLFHHAARSPGHVIFYRPSLWERKCQPCARFILSTMCPVCTKRQPSPEGLGWKSPYDLSARGAAPMLSSTNVRRGETANVQGPQG